MPGPVDLEPTRSTIQGGGVALACPCSRQHGVDACAQGGRRSASAYAHLYELPPAGNELTQALGVLGGQRPDGGPHRFGKAGDDMDIQAVRLGQRARGAGEVADLAGTDHCDPHVGAGRWPSEPPVADQRLPQVASIDTATQQTAAGTP
jgi:hypothetical protein